MMQDPAPPLRAPMGRLTTHEVGTRTMTIQTEFFHRPSWRIETKVYLGGVMKKMWTEELEAGQEDGLQERVDAMHDQRCAEILAGLRGLKA